MRTAVMVALALLSGDALAAEESATQALQARDAEIRAALPAQGAEVSPQVRKRLEAIVTRAVDLRGMVEASMGKHWGTTPEKQRKRLIAAFENRFRSTSGKEFDAYRSTQLEYRPEVDEGRGVVQVPTKVVVKGEPTEIAYRMRRSASGWRIVDIVVDSVSTVENYRSSFARVIQKEGVDGLIRRLERGSAGGAPATTPAAK
ncbi:MAG TPA: ABC transporter substrate-binding protein [Anaeromyxobacteraceae bacterium]